MKQKYRQKFQKGFTLIELLVVISIIGLLASIVLVSMNNSRIKGRDTRRVADLKQIRTALDLYYSDKGHYPISNCPAPAWTSFDSPIYKDVKLCDTAGASAGANNLSQEMASYVRGVGDPRNLGGDTGYLYLSNDGIDFCVMVYRTPENMKNFDDSLVNKVRCPVINSDGQCASSLNSIFFGTGPYANGC